MPINKIILQAWSAWLHNQSIRICSDSSSVITISSITEVSTPISVWIRSSLISVKNNIQVDYLFTNTSQHDLDVPVAFPMPPMYSACSIANEIENFKLWVNGQPQKTEHKLVVLLDEKVDISDKMAQLGWSADDVGAFIESEEIPQGKTTSAEWFDKDNQPRFTMSGHLFGSSISPRVNRYQFDIHIHRGNKQVYRNLPVILSRATLKILVLIKALRPRQKTWFRIWCQLGKPPLHIGDCEQLAPGRPLLHVFRLKWRGRQTGLPCTGPRSPTPSQK